ncbi:3-methyl-2-oxobutanoate hydroxymethyltransferase [Corynebacterium capitovis DSM 44611]|uniref:3-methyl-2-oxobutanoate hydroxymethyltransferase n=1 Tax=Corynebacterium capitovis TaxID=131081 RepID=UPI00037140CB|nr:3-methyl-2-oxobutanoate hydroxymethyltransferase [Corynebacterium capitovis]WKD57329.1 3-methyl-2-oxobutanoate hydroxymethyltransferase [Corynebacterium capitovis DSM 44611]
MTNRTPTYTPHYADGDKPIRLRDLVALKGQRPWAMLTAYDYSSARVFSAAGIECLLVGDSAANVVLGYDSTSRIGVAEMSTLAAAVVRGAGRAFVVVDLPFGSYEASNEQAVRSATELLSASGAHAVKIEGGQRIAPRIRALKDAGLAVCAHVGFTPQSVSSLGGFRVQGRGDGAAQVRADTDAVVAAGADLVVFEMVPAELAADITSACPVPTIGIGAGPGTDAQVLVWHDMARMIPGAVSPRFAPAFGEVGQSLIDAAVAYRTAVERGSFPAAEHSFAS